MFSSRQTVAFLLIYLSARFCVPQPTGACVSWNLRYVCELERDTYVIFAGVFRLRPRFRINHSISSKTPHDRTVNPAVVWGLVWHIPKPVCTRFHGIPVVGKSGTPIHYACRARFVRTELLGIIKNNPSRVCQFI